MSSPTTFPRYVNLPTELKLNIVQEAAEWRISDEYMEEIAPYCKELGQYACIDRVWQDVIERGSFRRLTINTSEIMEFGYICGKRYGILHKIKLVMSSHIDPVCGRDLVNLTEAEAISTLNEILYLTLEALFRVMKDWSTTERRRSNLISLELDASDFYLPFQNTIHYDFSGLPTVRVIGNVFSRYRPLFHPSSAISIYKKLPNLEVVYLQLEVHPTVPSINQEARDAIQSLQELCITPSKIKLVGRPADNLSWILTNAREELPILQCLISPCPPWSNTITELRLPSLNDVPDFLQKAQKTLWPQLRILKLGGLFDAAPAGSRKATGCMVVQALSGMLSKMPSIITVNIDVFPMVGWNAMKVDMYFGPDRACFHTRLGMCAPFKEDKQNGVAYLGRVSVPGYIVVWLQDAVWRHQRRKLAVCCTPDPQIKHEHHYFDWGDESDPDEGWFWGTRPWALYNKYKQWNDEKEDWDRFEMNNDSASSRWLHWELVEDSDESETGVS